MEVLFTKFHTYPKNTFQVLPLLRSIIALPGKKLLTPKKASGGNLLTNVFFSVVETSIYCRYKISMPSLFFALIACFWSKSVFNFKYFPFQPMEVVQVIKPDVSCHYLSCLQVCCLAFIGAKKLLLEVRGGYVYLGHKTGSGDPGCLGFCT